MEKAYELKGLTDELKDKGLDLAEDAALIIYNATMAWLKKSATISKNPYDDMLMIALPAIDSHAKGMIDKIDGKEG